ncbi:MAG: hypothetical protein ACYDCH_00675 [Gaiellaceae bacterium]
MSRFAFRRFTLVFTLVLLATGALGAAAAFAGGGQLTFSGATNLAAVPSSVGSATASSVGEFSPVAAIERAAADAPHEHHGRKASVPNPEGSPVAGPGSATVFNGLDHFAQRTANGGNQFSLEPPDQALCVGGGVGGGPDVLESANTVLQVYDRTGAPLTGVKDLNTFFGLPAQIDRSTGTFGPFLSDPKCYYDPDTGRFFLTVLELGVDPASGAFTGASAVLIAVSQTSDATGGWNLFKLDTTDNGTGGTPSHPGCPCLGDQPLIGADANGFYITTNEFPLFVNGFNGAQIYATSKRALEAGGPLPPVVQFANPALAEGVSYSVQPATSPNGTYETAAGGTEYFLSALDFAGTTDNRVALWAITNTSSLGNPSPSVSLSLKVLKSEDYAFPPDATQKDGTRPLGNALGAPLELLASNDDRMNQVVFAHGELWAGLNTAVGEAADSPRVGIAWFAVNPRVNRDGKLGGKVDSQGYVAVDGANVLFPSIGVNADGNGAIVYTLSGPDYYPSAAYTRLDGSDSEEVNQGPVQLLAPGTQPEDGFTGYPRFGGNGTARWGDYSAAVAGADGSIWIAGEYISGVRRTFFANWSTFVGNVTP